jgi:hypothetical protein
VQCGVDVEDVGDLIHFVLGVIAELPAASE